jgi:signal transduction histidine kinase/ActR/RegA family two-component response regulator
MRLLLLAASGLLPLVIVLGWGIDHLFAERKAAAQNSSLELSRALATAIDSEVRSVQALLEQMGTSDELERADLRAFHLSARRNAEQLGWRQVSLADGEGHVLFRSNQPFDNFDVQPIDPQTLATVGQTHKALVTGGVISPKDGLPVFAVRVPVLRGDDVVYILTAVISTDVISNVIARQNIPSDSVASVFDRAYRRLASSRSSQEPYASASLQALLNEHHQQGVGTTRIVEGREVYTGYTRMGDVGWIVTVGASVEKANAAFVTLLGATGLGLAASLSISFVLAWVLSRRVIEPIEHLKEGAGALGRGDPVKIVPLDIGELEEVAQALRGAATDRDRSRERVDEALRMAEDANRSKDQFLAVLGHELRNPLAPISNAVQLMGMKGDEATAQERRIIERQLVHVTRLVDDLLDVSRITSGRLSLKRKPLRIAHILEQVVDTIQPSLYQRTVALNIADGVPDAWVEGDEVRLVQVFNNLLVNAIKFTPAGGAIRVDAHIDGEGRVRIDVEDDGIGIAPEELKRVFELFYQSPQSSDRARGGLGLGLPIVKSLIEMHGGEVQASSAGPGQGTCFSVRLPVCEAPAVPVEEPAKEPHAHSSAARVLVVDDNEDAADTCATLLEMSGYDVRATYRPDAALKAVETFRPDVAILDIGLPGMNGYELARALRRAGFAGKLAALTGYGQAADMQASKAAGFDAHLTKPVSPDDLLDLVARFSGQEASVRAG